jgi:hypothetical protein
MKEHDFSDILKGYKEYLSFLRKCRSLRVSWMDDLIDGWEEKLEDKLIWLKSDKLGGYQDDIIHPPLEEESEMRLYYRGIGVMIFPISHLRIVGGEVWFPIKILEFVTDRGTPMICLNLEYTVKRNGWIDENGRCMIPLYEFFRRYLENGE